MTTENTETWHVDWYNTVGLTAGVPRVRWLIRRGREVVARDLDKADADAIVAERTALDAALAERDSATRVMEMKAEENGRNLNRIDDLNAALDAANACIKAMEPFQSGWEDPDMTIQELKGALDDAIKALRGDRGAFTDIVTELIALTDVVRGCLSTNQGHLDRLEAQAQEVAR